MPSGQIHGSGQGCGPERSDRKREVIGGNSRPEIQAATVGIPLKDEAQDLAQMRAPNGSGQTEFVQLCSKPARP